MDEMLYTKLTEVTGRWQADILEGYLKYAGIDAVLFQERVWHVPLSDAFAAVQVYVPRASIRRARELLRSFNEAQDEGEQE